MRVLIVDDAEDILELAAIGLSLGGHEATPAATLSSALEALQSGSFDLILLDYQLGSQLSGLEALPRLRQFSQAPVVFFTASSDASHQALFLQAGALGTLAKPFDPMALSARLTTLLQGT